MAHAEIWFPHDQFSVKWATISPWVMWKSDFHMGHVEIWFLVISAIGDFTNFLKMYGNLSMAIAYTNSYRNIGFPNGPVFRYGNFFIPRVKKSSKISPWEKNLASRGPTALGRTKFFALGLICEDFSTLGMKKFPYLKTGPVGNPIFPIDPLNSNLNNLIKKSWTDSNV